MTSLLVEGLPLSVAGRWVLDYDTLLPAVPARNVSRLEVPGRSGVVAKRLGWGVGRLRVSVSVLSWVDVPVVQGLLARASSVTKTGGPDLVADLVADVVDVVVSDPARLSRDAWQLQADFELQPFWREPGVLTGGPLEPGDVLFSDWAGSTGDVVDGKVRVKGPFTKLTIEHGGRTVSFDVTRSASQYLFFDPTAFVAWRGTSNAWTTPTSTANRTVVEYGPGGPLTAFTPDEEGVRMNVSGEGMVTTGATADRTQVTFRGGRWWL